MDICFCEIQKRFKDRPQLMLSFVAELERRGLLSSVMANQHGVYERVWKPKSA